MKVLQINTVVNAGSTGRIAESLGVKVLEAGGESHIAYGRNPRPSRSHTFRMGSQGSIWWHGIQTRLLDRHGEGSRVATRELVRYMEELCPDVIHLHNLHGYYLNLEILFDFLAHNVYPVVWTLHDCWAFTGHCCHFSACGCERWKRQCYACPQSVRYPTSYFWDRSRTNYRLKREWFTSVESMVLVPVSRWLGGLVGESFLSGYPVHMIYNGVDCTVFRPRDVQGIRRKYGLQRRFVVLGVANTWEEWKGLQTFKVLRSRLGSEFDILLVGLSPNQIQRLPEGIIGISRTEQVQELATLYSLADVYVNASVEETFGMTTAESLACGTPAVVWDVTACPEVISPDTGVAVKLGETEALAEAVESLCWQGKARYAEACVRRVQDLFKLERQQEAYYQLYQSLL